MYPDASRAILPGKTIQYAEDSLANWLMSTGALVFIIPALNPAAPSAPSGVAPEDFIDALDGLVLQGGSDISPRTYGEEPLAPEWTGDPWRDEYELALLRATLRRGRPVLGICRGCQLLNVAHGGALYQDLGRQVSPVAAAHRHEQLYDANHHEVDFVPGSGLARLYPGTPRARINSIHHQAIKTLGAGLRVEARACGDQVIEAVRGDGPGYACGIQWHPEFIAPGQPGFLDSRPILLDFLSACAAWRHPAPTPHQPLCPPIG
jgi:gamma-glutamyl-gamma-aminobutyrate hydrolase PuuD